MVELGIKIGVVRGSKYDAVVPFCIGFPYKIDGLKLLILWFSRHFNLL
jgi:hypothetical protein